MNYEELYIGKPNVLVEFFATWCPHCHRMMPIVDEIKELTDGNLEVYQLDIDQNSEAAQSVGADSVPTFILYRNGREVWRHTGEIDGQALLNKVYLQ